ncbi:deoxyribodipyrimidine photo-lyase [Lindgomyces ingoldianus]|uniref:Deoxyribodipyrimidine photo-lyase n=1 Tax=Lindgomyces ingoldianus TaxID=673940 RepID=A0ACB6QPZ1_9PLEO|nr:deoxyribodipyrimidine photo-lyase [Lindgomyces ingoldianus]KAF2469099.1 deoxyribodipyrimidine photo-lyase [Lindgomyces ingoldianus]
MPPKRKAKSRIPANAASATAYTDASGSMPNKRSKNSKPSNAALPKEAEQEFDHSRPEGKAGIVDRRFYPFEMSNERCAMYNSNEIPRPMEVLNKTLEETGSERHKVGKVTGEAVVHWFKRDLRVRDNTGLSLAAATAKEKGVGVIGVWILSPQDWEAHLVSPAKCDFEIRSVDVLRKELAELSIPLWIEVVEKRKDIPWRLTALAQKWGVKNVYCNLEYEPDELRREERLVRMMLEKGIAFEPQHDDCVVPPGSLKAGSGKQYAVYSPWFRGWIAHLHAHPHLLQERSMPEKNPDGFREKYASLFDSRVPDVPESKCLSPDDKQRLTSLWPAGENAALERLERFLKEKVGRYQATRNFPAENSTARVSVHHAAGTLAARTSVRLARDVNSTKKLDGGNDGIKGWISEVAWRDFYRHVLVNWPYVCMNKPFKYEYTNITWEYNPHHFTLWTTGRTGYPIVDAAMRCLASTAYMHNRLRMVTASFLAKHLLLDWRLGEQYFISHLIDGDFASNNGGWGFSSSTGVDPQPYFRVFNPWLQSAKFDAKGEFIRTWVEELKDVKGEDVHNPYEAGGKAAEIAERNGYPRPVVEHRMARERCLRRYKEGIGRGTA